MLDKAAGLLDFSQPIALMLIGILHLIPDSDDPAAILRRLVAALSSGSWVAIAHPASDVAADRVATMADRHNQRVSTAATLRTHADISAFFPRYQVRAAPRLAPVTNRDRRLSSRPAGNPVTVRTG